jgi:hypothetical protein
MTTLLKVNREYQRRKLVNALAGNFDFDRDYHAYVALVEGDIDELIRLLKEAGGRVPIRERLDKPMREQAQMAYGTEWMKEAK